jgi:outer membrane protein assembly factor BamB
METVGLRCPSCGAHLDGGERDTYDCTFCGAATPRTALVQPARVPFAGGIDRLYNTVAADFDQDGWFEICGWRSAVLYAIDLFDRTLMWKLDGFANDHDLYAGPGRVYVATDAELIALNAYTGVRAWTLALMNVREVHDPGYVPGGAIWAVTAQDQLVAIDRATGARRKSYAAHSGASLFRILAGRRLVMNDVDGLRVLDATQDGPVLQVATGALAALDQMIAGRKPAATPTQLDSAVVHRGVLYTLTTSLDGRNTRFLQAHRIADATLVARRAFRSSSQELVAAVAGRPVAHRGRILQLEPDGPAWTIPSGADAELVSAHGSGRVLVVHAKRTGPGSDLHSLTGLDATTFTPLWELPDVGYMMSDVVCTEACVVYAIDVRSGYKFVALDPASGTTLWDIAMPSETGLQVGGGLVVQTRGGATLVTDTGERMFPADERKTTPAGAPAAEPDELPDWGIEAPSAAPTGKAGNVLLAAVMIVIALVALGSIAAVVYAFTR